jgi:hypothetical protein
MMVKENIVARKRKIGAGFVCLFILIFGGCLPSEPATQTLEPTPAQVSAQTPTRPPTQEPTATPSQPPTATETKAPVPPPEGVLTQTRFEALVIDEYLLGGRPDYSSDRLVFHFAEGDKDEILRKTEAYRNYQALILKHNNPILERFGYRQEDYLKTQTRQDFWYSRLYQGDVLLADDIYYMPPVSLNASGTDFIVQVSGFSSDYVFTKDRFEKRAYPSGREAKLYVGDRLLSVEETYPAHQQAVIDVYFDDTLAYRSEFRLGTPTLATYLGPWSYDNHWAIALLDSKEDGKDDWEPFNRIVLDGKDLNSLYGYQETFQFTVLGGHPFYFYQKDGKIGISFDDVETDREYDEIPHYRCCSSAMLNPRISMNMTWFFAKRGPNWYYVEAYVPLESDQYIGP